MSRRLRRHAAACALTASLAALSAAVLPGMARADESVDDLLTAVQAVTETTASVPADALESVTEPVPAPEEAPAGGEADAPAAEPPGTTGDIAGAALSQPEPADVVQEAADPAETVAPEDTAATIPSPDPASAEATTGDTTAEPGDIAADTSSTSTESVPEPAVPPASTPEPAPAGSTNINVSVRIGSPGDNGAVTQLNVSTTVAQPPPQVGATAPVAPSQTASSAPATQESTASSPAGAVASDTWYWSWDCLDTAPISSISPNGSATGSTPTSWTWIWNCGDKSAQYHDQTFSGYQQINTNIAIRISSPGNDGPVTQANFAAGAHVAWQAPSASVPEIGMPLISLPSLGKALGETIDAAAAISLPEASDITYVPALESLPAISGSALVEAPPAPLPGLGRRVDSAPSIPFLVAPGGRSGSRLSPGRLAGDAEADRTGATWVAEGAAATLTPPAGPSARRIARPPAADSAPRPRSPLKDSAPTPTSGVSVGAAGGGGSSGAGFFFLLALPFVAVMLDLARRVAFERATWPPGHRRRVPDRPG